VASLALVLCFVLILFPYGRFREITIGQLAHATGASVSMEDLEGGLSVGGPSLLATNLHLRWPDRGELLLERARARPAWSLSWLRGDPALHVEMAGPAGELAGTVWPGPGFAFAGRVREVQLSLLPLEHLVDPPPILGRLDAEIDMRTGPEGPTGEVRFRSWEGSLALPQLPFGIPYENAHGVLERSESGSLTVREFELSGPMLSASAQGSIEASDPPEQGALDLEIDLLVVEPALRSMIQPYGIRLDPEGAGHLRVTGTVSHPILR
jgi:type II secretion system protein N